LHRHHVSKNGPLEFGHRYMQALAEDPWVGVYTCYGFGNQFVTDPNRTSISAQSRTTPLPLSAPPARGNA
jgi:hypothetical protein